MKASIIALVGAAAAVSAQNGTVPYTTSTVTQHTTYTITSCAATVTDCPAKIGQVTTEIVSVYTTYCPVAATETSTPAGPVTTPAGPPSGPYTTSTVYSTETLTISKCHPDVTNCPYTTAPVTTIKSYPVSTTVCPVTTETPVVPPKSSGVVPPPVYPTSLPGGVVSSAPAPPPYSASKPAGILSTMTISTCVPTTYTSVITVTPSAASSPAGPVGTGSSTSSGYTAPKSNSTVPFTGGANAQKAGGLLMAVGLVAALL